MIPIIAILCVAVVVLGVYITLIMDSIKELRKDHNDLIKFLEKDLHLIIHYPFIKEISKGYVGKQIVELFYDNDVKPHKIKESSEQIKLILDKLNLAVVKIPAQDEKIVLEEKE